MTTKQIRWIERVLLVSLLIVSFIIPSPYAVWQTYQAEKQLSELPKQKIEPKIEEVFENSIVAEEETSSTDEAEKSFDNLAASDSGTVLQTQKTKLPKTKKSKSKEIEKPKEIIGQVIAENYAGASYDEKAKTLSVSNPIGEIKEVAFNKDNLPEKTVDVSGNTTTAKYDENGNVTELKDPNGDTIHYNYDKKGRLLSSYTSNNSSTEKLSFWEKLTTLNFATADDKDEVVNLSYGETDEIANIENEVGTVTQEFTDDGNLAVAVDASGNFISYDYDELGNVIGKKTNAPDAELSMFSSLFVNAADETTKEEAKFAYDEEGNPESTEIAILVPETDEEIAPEEKTILDNLLSYLPRVQAKKMTLKKISQEGEFDAQGNRTGLANQNGEVTAFYFDENDNPIGSATADKDGNLLYEAKYTKDEDGYWNSKTDSLGNSETYTYDEKGQLLKYISNDQETAYAYDERGNLASESSAVGITSYLYEHNKLIRKDNPDGSFANFGYDQNGNLTDKTVCENAETCQTAIYSYTTNNYLESVAMPNGKTVFYAYDGLGRRVSKTIGSVTTTYLWEGSQMTAELDEKKNVIRQFVYDNENNLLSVIKGGVVYNLIKDSHGSTVALTNEDSKIVASFTYDAWGNSTETIKDSISPFLYSGYYYDEDIDAYIMGPRFYDPSYKRFFQKDPAPADLDDEMTLNEYIYCENNPVNNYDPDGHKSKSKNNGKSDKAAKEKAEKAKKEAEKREKEQKKKEEEAKKKQQKEKEEKAKKAREAAEKEKKKAQELAEKKAKEVKEKAEKERKQKEEAQKKAKKAAEKAQKEKAEKEKKAKAEAEKKAKEAKEKAEKAKAEAQKKAKKDAEKKAKELREAKEKAEKAKKEAQKKAEKAREKAKKEADKKAEKAKEEAKKKQTALQKSYSESKDIKKSVEKKIKEAKKKKKKVEDLLVLKELYYYQREYQKVSGEKQSLSVNGSSSKVAGASAKSLSSTVENGALSQNYSPATAKASSSNNNSLSISTPKVSFASLFLEKLWNTVSGASKWVATTAKNIVVQTVNDGEVCIKSGSLQDCLSTCGVSMDGATVALSPTVIGAGVAAGVGALCDFTNGLIYLAKDEKFQAGASMFAVIPVAGIIGKGAKAAKLSTKEAAEVAGALEKAGAKAMMKHTAYKCLKDEDITGKIYSGLKLTDDGKFRYFVNGERMTPSKTTDYILKDGKLKFGERHSYMSNGESVDYAGRIRFSSDYKKIEAWDNGSGHYLPSADDSIGQDMVKESFKKQFDLDLPDFMTFKEFDNKF